MMNVANPDEALRLSFLPNDGVGLARLEFIINNTIGIHPLALLDYDKLDDRGVIREIDRATVGYRRGFMLECRAMERVRRDMGLTNVKLMIPFCRTVEEGRRVISELEYQVVVG